ncbi:hypothetical protein [Pseudomonas zhanjiangensis]|uniref:Uncharacterized protein n=1 Tax=Pseudomonas zhanjiangensis TaxID=3239015 RepID=A0ABV3YMJ0_9PSED
MPKPRLLVTLPDAQSTCRARRLLESQVPGCEVLEEPRDCSQAALCRWLQELPPQQLGEVQALLSEAVQVLEHSRQAFKSAQLAALRKTLAKALEGLSEPSQSGKNLL